MINRSNITMLDKLLSIDSPPNVITNRLASLRIQYWPSFVLKLAVKYLLKKGALHSILLLADCAPSLGLTKSYQKKYLFIAEVHALISIKSYGACTSRIDLLLKNPLLPELSTDELQKIYTYLSKIYTNTGNLVEAESSLLKALQISRKGGLIFELIINFVNQEKFNSMNNLLEELKIIDLEKYFLARFRINSLLKKPCEKILVESTFTDLAKGKSEASLAISSQFFEKSNYIEGKIFFEKYFNSFGIQSPTWRHTDLPVISNLYCENINAIHMDPLVSVIMTCFNAEDTISFAINSVLKQSYTNIELIIVDDVSSDNSVNIIKECCKADNRIQLITNEINCGTYVSKNNAILQAKGAYITFHDSDDWHHPQRIETHIEEFKNNPSLMGVYSCWIRITESGHLIQQPWLSYLHQNPSSLLIKKSVIDDIGYFDSVRIAADSEFIFRMQAHYGSSSIKLIKKPLAIGLFHEKSLTRSGAGAYLDYRPSSTRMQYWNSYSDWHRRSLLNNEPLRMEFPLRERPFTAPGTILP